MGLTIERENISLAYSLIHLCTLLWQGIAGDITCDVGAVECLSICMNFK